MDDVRLDGAQRFVSDDHEDLLLLLQVDEVPEPGLLSQPEETRRSCDPGQLMGGRVKVRRVSVCVGVCLTLETSLG